MSRPDDDSAQSADPGRELVKVDPAEAADGAEAGSGIGATVAALSAGDLEPAKRRHLLARLVGDVRRRGLGQLFRPGSAMRWMTEAVADIAPHVPVRDLATLRRHYDGLEGDALAERLVRNAALAAAGVGAAGGGVASLEWAATPTLLSVPVLLAAETVAVVGIELKLVGELHEVYGRPVAGSAVQRASALIQSWAGQRGVNPFVPGIGVATVLGTTARRELQGTLLRRFGRNLTTLGPLLTGAAVASYLNRRATLRLGEQMIKDLRRKGPAVIDAGVPEISS
ncbi:hypothetical protein ACFQFC_30725 [Amorphoplanes digitatis]|uniref:EcsC family protein n=1 Tax=Actinoplanes digitatis TaxID=1868 RepID=A0A7W7HTK0_9ACTN|nr:hypothetical protein [Actinoplanes digitatis]MBB4760530.1 hypothetical protein [Actinoplanes digitatis]GID97083.1 hypothetical protein Adi01nite_64950 [Actinoplanes digitatis]